ncbi:MAG: hypothetical protein LBU43_02385 [Candidatus Accumulibacter sp.]|jgi:hypothetical protein|nr:hypothetical protein [Accumulibacter sp.]
MSKLAAFIATLFGSAFAWFSGALTSKVVAGVAVVTCAVTMAFICFNALHLLLEGVTLMVADETFRMIFWSVVPSNMETCFAACVAADMIVFIDTPNKLCNFFARHVIMVIWKMN